VLAGLAIIACLDRMNWFTTIRSAGKKHDGQGLLHILLDFAKKYLLGEPRLSRPSEKIYP
jgi:hypothetical protein